MLFNSFVFLLLFLPITCVVFWQLESRLARYAAAWAMMGKNMAQLRERRWRFRDAMAPATAGGARIAIMLSDAGSAFLYFQF